MEVLNRGSSPTMFELAVIGAGPGGTSAAITAARAGATVLLLERGRLPRQRVCGEFVSAESLELLRALLAEEARILTASLPIPRARLFLDGRVIASAVDPPAASIARFDLDFALWQAALRSGVRAQLQTPVERIEGTGPFQLVTAKEIFHATAVINATGRWSNLSHAATTPHDASGGRWLGVKAHFTESKPAPSVDLYFFEGGYCGVQPVAITDDNGSRGSRVNACAMVRADVANSLPAVFAQHPELARRARAWKPLMEAVSTSPLVFRTPCAVEAGVYLAGDSAGFVDPFVGDGISLALRSGAAAAQCVLPFLQGTASRAEAERRYSDTYEHQLLPIFRNSSRLRRLLNLPRAVRAPLASLLQYTPAFTSYLVSKTR